MEKSSNDPRDLGSLGCGTNNTTDNNSSSVTTTLPSITLNISTTTGGNFSVDVESNNTVENLKKIVAKKLRVAKDRICLLHRERELQEGTLKENGLIDESKIILIPNVETGLMSQRPENTVMQALESLNDNQVNDFLSGKTPLNLSMRLGDHMMLIQLQLSTVTPTVPATRNKASAKSRISSSSQTQQASTSTSSNSVAGCSHKTNNTTSFTAMSDNKSVETNTTIPTNTAISSPATKTSRSNSIELDEAFSYLTASPCAFDINDTDNETCIKALAPTQPTAAASGSTTVAPLSPQSASSSTTVSTPASPSPAEVFMKSKNFESLKNIFNSLAEIQRRGTACNYEADPQLLLEQSPIKSLSNLVSSPIKTTPIKSIPVTNFTSSALSKSPMSNADSTSSSTATSDAITTAKFTSCICKRLNSNSNCETICQQHQPSSSSTLPSIQNYSNVTPSTSLTASSSLPSTSTSSSKSVQSTLLHRTTNNPITKKRLCHPVVLRRSKSSDNIRVPVSPTDQQQQSPITSTETSPTGSPSDTFAMSDYSNDSLSPSTTGTLAEASRSLTQTLRKLSKEVFTNNKVNSIDDGTSKNSIGSGAVIESMKNHGKGIYSGTFSGTLNPALQDRNGRPKRDISTVIHILNDLLSATPHYTRGARICFEPTRTIKQASTSSFASTSSSTATSSAASTSRSQDPKDYHYYCTPCSQRANCMYGACNGNHDTSAAIAPYDLYCDKHKPNVGDSTPSTSPSTFFCASPTTSPSTTNSSAKKCPCSRTLQFDETSSKEQGGDSSTTAANIMPDFQNICHCGSTGSTPENRQMDVDVAAPTKTQTHVCIKCSNIAMENSKTKSKLEQIRLVMQQKKERREARKLQGSPYGARMTTATATAALATSAVTNNSNGSLMTASGDMPNDVQANLGNLVEEVDTAA